MRKPLLLLFMLALSATSAFAQTTCMYVFNNNLHDTYGHGADLTSPCPDSFASQALPISITRNVFHFKTGCGLTFNDSTTNFLSSGTYTIEMYVRLDTITGFKKLIDYKDTSADNGYYNHNGQVQLYPHPASDSAYIQDSAYTFIALVRDGASKAMFTYINNHYCRTDTDTANNYVYTAHKKLNFFRDDHGTGTEQTTGDVAMIRISNFAMDSNAVKNDYNNLKPLILNVQNTPQVNETIHIFPNPATNLVNISTTENYNYNINDISGRIILSGALRQGNNTISLSNIENGMYLLKLTNTAGVSTVYKIIKN